MVNDEAQTPAGVAADGEAVEAPPLGWRPSVLQLLTMVLAVAFLAAAAGFTLGDRRAQPNAVDLGFVRDMIDHHEQAIVMGKILQTAEGSPQIRHFANEITQGQSFEEATMLAWLAEWKRDRGPEDRAAMEWMPHGSHPMDMNLTVATMPGMATEAQLQLLQEAKGADADTLFVRMMIAPPRGGGAMADAARLHAGDPRVRDLAGRIYRYQKVEIREMEQARARVGLPA